MHRSKRARARHEHIQAEAGFSLIELVVVIAILGILIALALPAYTDIQKDAQVNTIKNVLTTINKECVVAGLRKASGSPTFVDIRAWKTYNKYGPDTGHPGWGWKNWTYDTSLTSRDPINAGESCYSIAAKSTTTEDEQRLFPDFEIRHDSNSGQSIKSCTIANPGFTYNNSEHCMIPPAESIGTW